MRSVDEASERRLIVTWKNDTSMGILPVAELIRRAVDKTYRPHVRPTVRGVEVSVGFWRRPDAAVAGRRPRTLDERG